MVFLCPQELSDPLVFVVFRQSPQLSHFHSPSIPAASWCTSHHQPNMHHNPQTRTRDADNIRPTKSPHGMEILSLCTAGLLARSGIDLLLCIAPDGDDTGTTSKLLFPLLYAVNRSTHSVPFNQQRRQTVCLTIIPQLIGSFMFCLADSLTHGTELLPKQPQQTSRGGPNNIITERRDVTGITIGAHSFDGITTHRIIIGQAPDPSPEENKHGDRYTHHKSLVK